MHDLIILDAIRNWLISISVDSQLPSNLVLSTLDLKCPLAVENNKVWNKCACMDTMIMLSYVQYKSCFTVGMFTARGLCC